MLKLMRNVYSLHVPAIKLHSYAGFDCLVLKLAQYIRTSTDLEVWT